MTQETIRWIGRCPAELEYDQLCENNGIPRRNRSAKCFFHKTQSSFGNQSHFGLTPLWDNVLRKNAGGEVLYTEFRALADDVIEAAKVRQKARRK